eukprot:763363-Hanusia_phi.AAC.2
MTSPTVELLGHQPVVKNSQVRESLESVHSDAPGSSDCRILRRKEGKGRDVEGGALPDAGTFPAM